MVRAEHGKQLVAAAARLLVDLVGAEMGLLDQEMAKLSAYVGEAKRIDAADVDALVGDSRAENTWKIFDLIGDGKTGEALTLLDRLFSQGEDPFRLLGAFSMQLRRLAQAGRLDVAGDVIVAALEEVGVPPFGRRGRGKAASSPGPPADRAGCSTGCCRPTSASRASANCRRAPSWSGWWWSWLATPAAPRPVAQS